MPPVESPRKQKEGRSRREKISTPRPRPCRDIPGTLRTKAKTTIRRTLPAVEPRGRGVPESGPPARKEGGFVTGRDRSRHCGEHRFLVHSTRRPKLLVMMNRAMWTRAAHTARLLAAIRPIARLPAPSRRPFSVLLKDNPYLPQLLASNGLSQFSDPPDTAHPDSSALDAKYTFSFAIDRQAVQPSCQITVETQSELVHLPVFHYPPFYPSAKATQISTIDPRVKAVADVLWKSFCVNDFLNLDVTGLLHCDGSWSFEQCEAVVDESAGHRQGELFKHVTRYEYPEEIEAEKSLLVYRRYHRLFTTVDF